MAKKYSAVNSVGAITENTRSVFVYTVPTGRMAKLTFLSVSISASYTGNVYLLVKPSSEENPYKVISVTELSSVITGNSNRVGLDCSGICLYFNAGDQVGLTYTFSTALANDIPFYQSFIEEYESN